MNNVFTTVAAAAAVMLSASCSMLDDEVTRAFVVEKVRDAATDAVSGDWVGASIAGVTAIIASIWGTNAMRNRARQIRGEPVRVVPPVIS
jgi:hypothetical protein